jgi:hypothetical protein
MEELCAATLSEDDYVETATAMGIPLLLQAP